MVSALFTCFPRVLPLLSVSLRLLQRTLPQIYKNKRLIALVVFFLSVLILGENEMLGGDGMDPQGNGMRAGRTVRYDRVC